MTLREKRLLDIETARVRHAWARAQIESSRATPALTKYLSESLMELGVLKANDFETRLVRLPHSAFADARPSLFRPLLASCSITRC